MALNLLIPYCKRCCTPARPRRRRYRCKLGMLGEAEIAIVSEESFVRMKTLRFAGLMALCAVALYSQPTNGPVYWSTSSALDCSTNGLDEVTLPGPGGATVYACRFTGTFVWFAAGGGYTTALRVAAPASAPVGIDYSFYDVVGNYLNVDTNSGAGSATTSGNDVNFALTTNQPSEIDILGATANAPGYGPITDGSVFVQVYCPDSVTCYSVLPQLIYSAPPTISLSVPLAFDPASSSGYASGFTQWSAQGIDNGGSQRISLVIYNQGSVATIYTVRVYDSNGNLVGTGTTQAINGYSSVTGEAGTYGALLSNIIATSLPSGILKVFVDGGSNNSSILMLQTNGRAIAPLQVSVDTGVGVLAIPGPTPAARRTVGPASIRATPRQVFGPLPK